MLSLETDRVDAYATDHILLYGLISKSKNPDQFEVVGDFLSFDPYALMVRRDDSAFELIGKKRWPPCSGPVRSTRSTTSGSAPWRASKPIY